MNVPNHVKKRLRILITSFLFPWPDTLLFYRHAESVGNVEYNLIHEGKQARYSEALRKTRNMDIPLSPLGRKQAIITKYWTRQHYPHIDKVFVSPFRRPNETAEIVLPEYIGQFEEDFRLREKDFGVFDALSDAERQEKFAEYVELKDLLKKYYFRLPGGENYPDMLLRAGSFLNMLKREHCGEIVAVFAHSAIIESFRFLLQGLNEKKFLQLAKTEPIRNTNVLVYTEYKNRIGKSKLRPSPLNPINPWKNILQ